MLLSFALICHYICGDNFCGVVYIGLANHKLFQMHQFDVRIVPC